MAEIWPGSATLTGEGLNLVITNSFPRATTSPGTTYLALFTAFTATTVGSRDQGRAAYTEPSGGAYARQSVANTSWAAPAEYATNQGRQTTAAQVTFPTATATWGTVNGFFLADASTVGNLYFAANFDDTTAVTINTNDIIKLTPTIAYGH